MAKFFVSFTLCIVLVLKAEWVELAHVFRNCNQYFLSIAFGGMVGGVFLSAYKWQVLLRIHTISVGFWTLSRYYFTAVFFNNFLPSNIGGDAYRIYKTVSLNTSGAVVAILVERITGLWAFIVLGCLGAIWLYFFSDAIKPSWLYSALWFLVACACVPPLAGIFLISNPFLKKKIRKLSRKIRVFFERTIDYKGQPLSAVYVLIISFFFQLYTLGWMLILTRAVQEPIVAYKLIIGMVLSNLVALLPISLNGIGLLDGSFIFTMSAMGMPYDKALMVMLLIRCALLPLSLVGCIFYLQERNRSGANLSVIANQLWKEK